MAHNLEIKNGVASFASTQTAWHGLGQIVDGAMTAQQAIKLAHLDYEVVKVPNFAYYNGEFLDTPSSFSTLRTDTGQILGDRIGKNYTIVQNSEAFEFFDTLTGAGAAIYEALALKTPRIVAPPTESPTMVPVTTPKVPAKIGKINANTPTIAPTFFISPQLVPAK